MDRIMEIAKKHNLDVIEDCAHTHGSQWKGKGAGTIGKFGSYSFQRSKLMNSGEGGALLTQDENLYWKVQSLRMCGRKYNEQQLHSGNYRITSFQAAILRGQLAAMRENANLIDKFGKALDRAISQAPGVSALRKNENITRQCSYRYAFIYEKEEFDGLDCAIFRKALSAELGVNFDTTYEPLNMSSVYYPHTLKRCQISKEYVKAINPSRWELPVCEDLWRDSAVTLYFSPVFHSTDLHCRVENAKYLTDAIVKVYENRHEIFEKAEQKA